jgi:hypothetical protein
MRAGILPPFLIYAALFSQKAYDFASGEINML